MTETVLRCDDRNAYYQSFDIPLPWAGERFIDVVDVEDQALSGDAYKPKFDACASPHNCAVIPVCAVAAGADAMISAEPRKNANGEASIRPYRTGSRSGTRELA
jgi:hypothetical protein